MVKRKSLPKNTAAATTGAHAVPEISLREHATLAAKEWLHDFQLKLESQVDALLERVGLVRKSQV